MHRQMCWLSNSGDSEKILYLQVEANKSWRPYTAYPQFAVPDYQIPGGSKGWATYQKLLKAGWTLVPSARANEFGTQVQYSESMIQNQ
ncbi:hypothetical protein LC593_09375 [Nostoc sp. CHAB 5844]|nr:hypothetical protein [Nostoc sp. CHAB 5844]